MQAPQHLERTRGHRRTGQSARADLLDPGLRGVQPRPRDRGVGGDDAGQPQLHREIGDRVDVLVGQVRRDLHEHRDVHGVEHGLQQRAQRLDGLQIPQARRVGGTDVDDEEVRQRAQQPGARGVVARCVLGRDDLRLADVGADRHVAATVTEVVGGIAGAVVVEAHPVDQGPVVGQPEQSRGRVSGLRLRGDGADLGEAEAQRTPRVDTRRVLVEAGGQAHRGREVDAERRGAQRGIVDDEHLRDQRADRREARDEPHRREREMVDAFRGDPEHQTKKQVVHESPRGRMPET